MIAYCFIVWDDLHYRHQECVYAENEDCAWEIIRMNFPNASYIKLL